MNHMPKEILADRIHCVGIKSISCRDICQSTSRVGLPFTLQRAVIRHNNERRKPNEGNGDESSHVA